METNGSECKEVLLVFNKRKKPVRFQAVRGDPTKEQSNLYNAAKEAFQDVLIAGEGSSSTNHSTEFYLEFNSEEWGGEMVDVSGSITVPTKSTVYLRLQQAAGCSPQETAKHVSLYSQIAYVVIVVCSIKFHQLLSRYTAAVTATHIVCS